MLRSRRLAILLVLAIGCGLLAAAPSSARSQHSQRAEAGGVASALVTELAKTGVKAGIAYLAPDMVKYSDPTAYQLSQIQAQLAQIQSALANLSADVNRLDLRLACHDQLVRVEPILTGVIAAEKALRNATLAPTETGKKERLDVEVMPLILKLDGNGDQQLLHRALTGAAGPSLITACGKYIQEQNGPVLTNAFSQRVENVYSTYAMTAATLLMLRVNYWHYYPHRYGEAEIQQNVAEVQRYLTVEQALLKKPVSTRETIDLRTGWAWENRTLDTSHLIAGTLHQQGYKLSGWDQTPTCGDIVSLIQGFPGPVATTMSIFDEKVRCHNGWDGVINLKTKGGGNTGLSFVQLGQLRGMAAKPIDVSPFSYA
jgi:hypothetical protein